MTENRAQRDGDAWAKPVAHLEVTGVEPGSSGINVAGRRPTSPVQGFGRMWQKTYRIRLEGADVEPAEVIAVWKRDFPTFWPKGNRFFAPLAGIAPGEVAVLDLTMPGGLKLSCGENPKNDNGQVPTSRMGTVASMREEFGEAEEYAGRASAA